MSEKEILIQLNFFGPLIYQKNLSQILRADTKKITDKHGYSKMLLESLFGMPIDNFPKKYFKRYIEVTTKETHSVIVPHTKNIHRRLLIPLANAKKNYCFGDYLATIALCGLVAEMLVYLIWEINDIKIKGKKIKAGDEKGLFGNSFNELKHARRVKLLNTLGFITPKQFQWFQIVYNTRNNYVHSWIINSDKEKTDALSLYKHTFKLFMEITEIGITDKGIVKINPKMLKFFKEQ